MRPEMADWCQRVTNIKQGLRNLALPEVPTPESPDVVTEGFFDAVVDVVHSSVPRARPSPHAKRWWMTDLTLLRSWLCSARNHVNTMRRRGVDPSEAQMTFQATQKEYSLQIDKHKRAPWKDYLQDPSNIWKANAFTRMASQGTAMPTLHQEETATETDEEKANMLMGTFFPIPPERRAGRRSSENRQKVGRAKVPQELPRITEEEIRQAINSSNPRMVSGAYEIIFEMWRWLLPYVGSWLQWIYQASVDLAHVPKSWRTAKIVVLKKPGKADYTIRNAYRPISLLPTISKRLEAIMATRLSYMAEKYSLLPTTHFGAKKQWSCEQALDLLVEKIFEAWRANRVLALVNFDVQGAFNSVHSAVLGERLRERGVSEGMVKWIRSFCEERTGSVVVGGYTSALTALAPARIPQETPLSQILYVFYNANLVQGMIGRDGGSLGFIDDFTAWRTDVRDLCRNDEQAEDGGASCSSATVARERRYLRSVQGRGSSIPNEGDPI